MTLPTFNPDLHDVGIGQDEDTIYGFMLMSGAEGGGSGRQDNAPAVAQSAEGESRDDSLQTESFFAPNDWEGGAGQLRHVAIDQYGHGIGHGEFGGEYQPPKLPLAGLSNGTSWILSGKTASVESTPNANATLYTYTTGNIHPNGGVGVAITATPREYPASLGSGVVLWANTSLDMERYHPADGLSSATEFTAPTGDIEAVARFAKYVVALGHEPYIGAIGGTGVGDPTQVDSSTGIGFSNSVAWSEPTTDDSLLLLIVTADIPLTSSQYNGPVDSDWQEIANISDGTSQPIAVYYIEGADSRAGAEGVTFTAAANSTIVIMEIPGIATVGSLDEIKFATGTASPATTGAAALTDVDNEIAVVVITNDVASTFATPAGYTDRVEISNANGSIYVGTKLLTDNVVAENPSSAVSAGNWSALVVTFRGNTPTAITETWDTFAIWYSANEGITWKRVPVEGISGIGIVTCAEAGINNLWFTTSDGLFRLTFSESRTDAGEIISAAFAHVDKWSVPETLGNAGTRIVFAQGAVFTNLGKTLRRYVIGGTEEDRSIWPPESWGGPIGDVRGLYATQGQVFFCAGDTGDLGFLYHYNGRGFFPVAQEETTGDFNHIHYHGGYLYYKGGTKRFYYGDLGVRFDLVDATDDYVTTGYLLQSGFDYGKVSAVKLGRRFETKSLFTAATDSGSIALYYATDPTTDPIKEGGAAPSTTWTLIGTHSVTDGYSKRHTLTLPISFERIYYKVVLTKGTNGYPRFQGFSGFMRAMMESFKRFPLSLDVATDTVDNNGKEIYVTKTDVEEAVAYLEDLREQAASHDEQIWFYLTYPEGTQYICTAEGYSDMWMGRFRNNADGYVVMFTAQEVP